MHAVTKTYTANNLFQRPVRLTGTFNAYFSSTIPNTKLKPKNGNADKSKASLFPKKEKHSDVTDDAKSKQSVNKQSLLKYKLSLRLSQRKNVLFL